MVLHLGSREYTRTRPIETLDLDYCGNTSRPTIKKLSKRRIIFTATKFLLKPYPTVKGMQAVLSDLAVRNPKAKDAQPSQLVNLSFLKQLDESGYIDRLYKTPR